MRGHSECLAKLLEDGADVTLVGAEDTPLHMAALFNKLDCAKLLLS
jgi:ankyrin repeat protein